jgi:hypothetical protein
VPVEASAARKRIDPGRRGLNVSERGVPTGPPSSLPVRRAVVWAGAAACGAASLLCFGLLDLCAPFKDALLFAWISSTAAFFFGGHFVGSLADQRKFMHCLCASLHCTGLYATTFLVAVVINHAMRDRSNQMPEHVVELLWATLRSWQFGAILGTLLVAFWLGGFSERLVIWLARAFGSRPRWQYTTADGTPIDARGPWRHPVLAFLWRLVGVAFLFTSWAPVLLEPRLASKIMGVISFLILGWACFALARKRTARDVHDLLEEDFDPPIVYLRSFRHDGRRVGEGILHDYTRMLFTLFTSTPEEQLARIMNNFGPFVAIGKPGEELPEFGAARMYVEDDDWQTVVADLLNQEGSAAILQAGETQGLRWELHRIGRVLQPEQVLLFVPFGLWARPATREKLYTEFRSWAEECLGTRLPRKIGHSCFIYFTSDPEWQAFTLEKDDIVPEEHELAEILQAIQHNRALWPRRGITIWKVLGAICLFPLALAAFIVLIFLLSGIEAALRDRGPALPERDVPQQKSTP